jgi:hypothetical protein
VSGGGGGLVAGGWSAGRLAPLPWGLKGNTPCPECAVDSQRKQHGEEGFARAPPLVVVCPDQQRGGVLAPLSPPASVCVWDRYRVATVPKTSAFSGLTVVEGEGAGMSV